MSTRREIVSVYRQILRVGKSWTANTGLPKDTLEERKYIKDECKLQFRQNSELTDEKEIERYLEQAKTRLALALHYGNPYPRPVNLPPMALASHGKTKFKVQKRSRQQAKPVYLHSHKELE